jgi:hypothetical protein
MKEELYCAAQIEKARKKEKVIQSWLGGEKLSLLIKDAEIKLTRSQWWILKKRYKEKGFWGLIDLRKGGNSKKITEEIKEYIKETKKARPEVTSRELKEYVHHRFGKDFTRGWIGKIIKGLGDRLHLGRPQTGRRDYSKGIAIDHAGVYFLKGADAHMEGVKTITDEIIKGREKDIPEKSALERIRGTTPDTIRKKVETLLYLPIFGMQKPYHLLKYHKKGLGIVTDSGKRYSYQTADIFLCDIEKLNIQKEVGDALARCYIEALGIEVELEDGSYFYIDGHSKHVWSSKNIPKAYFSTLKRMERGLHQYFIHSSKGDPLILMTCPGDTRLPGTIFNLIGAFENAIGKKIVKVAIFDREGLSLSIFEEFNDRKKYFICLLREDMYRGIKSFKILKDFIPLKTIEKDGKEEVLEWIAEAEYELKERKRKGEEQRLHPVRVALVKRIIDEEIKLIPIITNLTRKEEPNIARIAKRYFDRWPYQENIFKDTMKAIKVDTNHGYKKREVPNRVVDRKREELETNLRGITQKLRKATKDRRNASRALIKLKEFFQTSKQIYQQETNDLYAKIGLPISHEERQQYLSRLKFLENKLTKLSEECGRNLIRWEVTIKNKEQHVMSLLTQKKYKEMEIKKLDTEKRPLYEIKTDKDHLMSNFKMLLINLSSYVQRTFFPEVVHNFTMDSMMKAFYQQDGYIKIKDKRIDVTLQSYDDPFLQKAAEYACWRFNESDRRTLAGQRIWMGVEGQNVKF